MTPRSARRGLAARALCLAITLATSTVASNAAGDLSANDATRLLTGEMIVEETSYQRGDHDYVGGVAYLVVDAPVARLSSIVRDVSRMRELLPHVEEVTLLSMSAAGRARVRVTHAIGPMSGGYTLEIAFSQGGTLGRFYIDRGANNSVDDAWGFVRLTTIGDGSRTLVTYGLLFDLGSGLLRTMFESRIRKAALSYPRRLADAAR